MEWLSILVSLASLIIGWFLNELAKNFQMRRVRRAFIGRALSNLLELYHQIRSIEWVVQHFMERFKLSGDTATAFRLILEQTMPKGDEYAAKYVEAIEQLSETDPMTAFDLRTKGQVQHFLSALKSLSSSAGVSQMEISIIEKQLKEMMIPALEGAICELAKLYGGQTKRQVATYLASPVQLPEELNRLIKELETTGVETNS